MNRQTREHLINLIFYAILIFFGLIVLIPFAWMLMSSFKLSKDVFTVPMRWLPPEWVWSNYPTLFERVDFARYMFNSFKVSIFVTLFQLFTSTFAAYGFAKLRFAGRDVLFYAYIATISIPWYAYMIPQFIIMRKAGLVNSHLGMIILLSFSAFGVFLVRQFYTSIPDDLCEAARIDGLSEYGIYARIMLPLSKPVISTLAVFTFTNVWNDYMCSLIYINSDEKKLIQLGLRSFITAYNADYALIMTGCVISLVPIVALFLFLQRYLIEGIATTGMKG